jgi:hypothetical protein
MRIPRGAQFNSVTASFTPDRTSALSPKGTNAGTVRMSAMCNKQHWQNDARTKRKTALRRSLRISFFDFDQAARARAAAFRFLRQPSIPIAPRPVAKSGKDAGSGVSDAAVNDQFAASKISVSGVTGGL